MRFAKLKSSGFTLIELLIVIGILGVLAAALIATIDPFEQLKKSQDANSKNVLVEFNDANIRYYTTHNAMPWADDANCLSEIGTGTTLNNTPSCLNDLINNGELKQGFNTVTSVLKNIYVSKCGNTQIICYNPKSLSQNHDINTKYDQFGNVKPGCPVKDGISTSCYWCSEESSCQSQNSQNIVGSGGNLLLPTSTPTPIFTPTPTTKGVCEVRNSVSSLAFHYSDPDVGSGYVKAAKPGAYTITQLRASCTPADYQTLLNIYCQNNSLPVYREVITYSANGNFSSSGCYSFPGACLTYACGSVFPTLTPTPISTPSATPMPTPQNNIPPATETSVLFYGINGTWCYDSDELKQPVSGTIVAGTQGFCADNSGVHIDSSIGSNINKEWTCGWDGINFSPVDLTPWKYIASCKYAEQVCAWYTGGTTSYLGACTENLRPTPVYQQTIPSNFTIKGSDGTWCYDSKKNGDVLTRGTCQDNTGLYADYCSSFSANNSSLVESYYCAANWDGSNYTNARCGFYGFNCPYINKICSFGACR